MIGQSSFLFFLFFHVLMVSGSGSHFFGGRRLLKLNITETYGVAISSLIFLFLLLIPKKKKKKCFLWLNFLETLFFFCAIYFPIFHFPTDRTSWIPIGVYHAGVPVKEITHIQIPSSVFGYFLLWKKPSKRFLCLFHQFLEKGLQRRIIPNLSNHSLLINCF